MKRPIEQLRDDLNIAQENFAESETTSDRDYWRKVCNRIYEEIDGIEDEE